MRKHHILRLIAVLNYDRLITQDTPPLTKMKKKTATKEKKNKTNKQNEKKNQTNTSALLLLCLKTRLIGEESKKHVPDKNKVNR